MNINHPHTLISLDSLHLYAFHGVGAQERVIGNDFEVSVDVAIPAVGSSASLDDSISYAYITEVVKQEMAIPSDLLEQVGARIRDRLTDAFPIITGGCIRISKLTPPIPGAQMKAASVSVIW